MRTALISFFLFFGAVTVFAQDVVRVGAFRLVHYNAVWFLEKVGAKYNIKFDIREIKKSSEAIDAIKAGDIDIAATSMDAAIIGRNAGVPLYIVAGFSKGGLMIVGRSDLKWTSLNDLKGKKVGVVRGGAQELALLNQLPRYGLTYSDKEGKDVQIVNFPTYPALNDSLASRYIDAMCQTEPQAAVAVIRGFGKEIIRPYDDAYGMPVRSLSMSEKFYAKKNLAERAMKAFVEATTLFINKSDTAREYYMQTVAKGSLSVAEFNAAIANAPYTTDITEDHVQITINRMVKYGVGKLTYPPVAKDFVKLDLLEKAKKDLNIK
jgi:NitT/TauT family transport system substrate-binding protein